MDKVIEKQVQIVHPEKVYPYLRGLRESTLAPLYGLSLQDYQEIRASFAKRVDAAAAKLLSDAGFKTLVQLLPFKPDDVILVLGESNTDDNQSWFEILKAVVSKTDPDRNITLINAAIAGQTTTQALRNITSNLQAKPSWIFCMLGMNDALRIGGSHGKTMVSLSETKLNLDAMHDIARSILQHQWVWLTPYGVDENKQDQNTWFRQLQLKWLNADLDPIHDYLLSKNDFVVDLWKAFKAPYSEHLLMEDGVHASLDGHVVIVRELVSKLNNLTK